MFNKQNTFTTKLTVTGVRMCLVYNNYCLQLAIAIATDLH